MDLESDGQKQKSILVKVDFSVMCKGPTEKYTITPYFPQHFGAFDKSEVKQVWNFESLSIKMSLREKLEKEKLSRYFNFEKRPKQKILPASEFSFVWFHDTGLEFLRDLGIRVQRGSVAD